jgi:hypothetical protein
MDTTSLTTTWPAPSPVPAPFPISAVSHAGKHSLICLNVISRTSVATAQQLANSETRKLETPAKRDNVEMSASATMTMRDYAGREWPADSHKARITRLARRLHWGHRRTRSLYNGEPVALRANELAELQQLTEAARHEHRELAQLASSLQALLFGPEADNYRPQVDAIRAALVPKGFGPARAGAETGPGDSQQSNGHADDYSI